MSVSSIPAKLRIESSKSSLKDPGSLRSLQESGFSKMLTREVEDIKSLSLWRGAFAELIGCIFLTMFTIGYGLKKDGEPGPPLFHVAVSVGFTLAVLITALSEVSGAHVNPAISIGFYLTRQITFIRFIVYSIFQICGSIIGAGLLKLMMPEDYVGSLGLLKPGPGVTPMEAFGMEFLITCHLLFMTMAFVDPGRTDLGGSIPFLCGCLVCINVMMGGNVSGGCMNPIRNFAPAMILGEFDNIWIYWAGPMAGGIVGTLLYDLFFSMNHPLILTKLCSNSKENKNNYEEDEEEELQDNIHQTLLNGNTIHDLENLDSSPESKV